jgi:toxin ParE1/3/4
MSRPTFRLTRRAARDLRDIHARSVKQWGEVTAHRYLDDLYAAMARAAAQPDIGRLRQQRTAPFLMVPARRHFVVCDRIPEGIVILTILHQVRDIESLITNLAPAFLAEIEALKGER